MDPPSVRAYLLAATRAGKALSQRFWLPALTLDHRIYSNKIKEITEFQLRTGTVCRELTSAGLVWRRAAPTLRIRDPYKDEKRAEIHKAQGEYSAENPVFYEDEVDIYLNPKIGADWQVRDNKNVW